MSKVSVGNMGYSKAQCSNTYIDWSAGDPHTKLHFSCPKTTKIVKVISSGVGSASVDEFENMDSLNEQNRCYHDKPVDTVKHPLMLGYQADEVEKTILDKCKLERKCEIKIPHKHLQIPTQSQLYDQFLFAQVSCEQDSDDIFFKSHMGLIVASFGLFICWVFRLSLNYMYTLD